MGGSKGAFGAQVALAPPTAAASGTPSTSITGLSSRQPLFGSSVGGVAQDAIWQYDSTLGRIGLGSSAPEARFYAVPPAGGANAFGWATTAGVHSGGVNSSGHLGLGTTAPTAQLHLSDGGAGNLRLSAAAIGSSFVGIWSGTAAPTISNAAMFMDPTITAVNAPTGGNVSLRVANVTQLFLSSVAIGVFGQAGSTRLTVTTVAPAAVYTSDVGREVNQIVEALRAYGWLT